MRKKDYVLVGICDYLHFIINQMKRYFLLLNYFNYWYLL